MFNIEDSPSFTETIRVTAPGGAVSDFSATFLALDIDAFTGHDIETPEGTEAFLEAVVLGVRDIIGRDNRPMADTPEVRRQLYGRAWVRSALVRGYFEGVGRAIRGN